jgi:hypothetical protein
VIAAQSGIPWWSFQSHAGPPRDSVLHSVDPEDTISRSIETGERACDPVVGG